MRSILWSVALPLALAGAAVAADAPAPSAVLDRVLVTDEQRWSQRDPVRGEAFKLAQPGEPLWIVMHVVAEASAGDAGEAVWELALEGVPMAPMDTVALFRARFMQPVRAGDRPAGDVRQSVLMKRMSTAKWDANEETFLRLTLKSANGLKPRRVGVVIGQGEMPPELRTAIDQARGSWFQRYRIVVTLIGAVLLFGVAAWWRLLRRR